MSTIDDQAKRPERRNRSADIRHALHLIRGNYLVLAGMVIAAGTVLLAILSALGLIVNLESWHHLNFPLVLCWNNPYFTWNIPNLKVCSGTTVFPLGTDTYGRNLLNMIIIAVPLDLEVSLVVVASAILIGIAAGGTAAYAGGWVDEVILRATDVFFAMPTLVLGLVLLVTLGQVFPRSGFAILTLALVIIWWPYYARLVRSQVISEKQKPYVLALRSVGAGNFRILFRHIIRNSIYPIFVQASLDVGGVILVFSAFTFLGFSPNQEQPELGNL
ncbi:MAG: ABC transporter permease, partial [Thaumarchaeota archaeon]|nr:ABC transporter permease [Nitrososphaerota archaeon]